MTARRATPGDVIVLELDEKYEQPPFEVILVKSLGWAELFQATRESMLGHTEYGIVALQPSGKVTIVKDFMEGDEDGEEDGELSEESDED